MVEKKSRYISQVPKYASIYECQTTINHHNERQISGHGRKKIKPMVCYQNIFLFNICSLHI